MTVERPRGNVIEAIGARALGGLRYVGGAALLFASAGKWAGCPPKTVRIDCRFPMPSIYRLLLLAGLQTAEGSPQHLLLEQKG